MCKEELPVPFSCLIYRTLVSGLYSIWQKTGEFLPEDTAAAKSLQLCLTLCDPLDGSPPGSPVPGVLQARTLEWVAISLSNAWKWKVKVKSLSRIGLLVTPWTAAYQAPPSMGFSRLEYWSGVPLSSPTSLIEKKWCIVTFAGPQFNSPVPVCSPHW